MPAEIIRCFCGYDHDDGFTVQCEKCHVWQHAVCSGYFEDALVPEVYVCERCSSRSINVKVARKRQDRYLRGQGRARSPSFDESRKRRSKSRSEGDQSDPEAFDPALLYVNISESYPLSGVQEYLKSHSFDEVLSLSSGELAAEKPVAVSIKRANDLFARTAFAIVADASCRPNRFVGLIRSEIRLENEYVADPINQYSLLGGPKPGVFFVPSMGLCFDARRQGCKLSFLRWSSTPNARLQPLLLDGSALYLAVYTTKTVKAGCELSIPWQWHETHPLHKIRKGETLLPVEETFLQRCERVIKDEGIASSVSDCVPGSDTRKPQRQKVNIAPPPPAIAQVLYSEWVSKRQTVENTSPVQSPVKPEYTWVCGAAEERKEAAVQKKKLSFADYKKGRRSLEEVPRW